jgi:single-stranded DNA-binding protein
MTLNCLIQTHFLFMNEAFVCAQLDENPEEAYISSTNTVIRCRVLLPPVGNKAPTPIEYNVYGKQQERFNRLVKGALVYIHGAKLRFNLETRTYSLHGGIFAEVTKAFPILNDVVLTGRCVKNIDQDDARAFKTTADGYMICNQTLSVMTGGRQADLFNFVAIGSVDSKPNYAELLVNFTRKGTGLTIKGKLVTDSWIDKTSKEKKSSTKIQLSSMTLAPKDLGSSSRQQAAAAPVASEAAAESEPSLWGGRTAEESDAWSQASGSGLPDLPGQYGSVPDFDSSDAPF